jgi:hypothetical protein
MFLTEAQPAFVDEKKANIRKCLLYFRSLVSGYKSNNSSWLEEH